MKSLEEMMADIGAMVAARPQIEERIREDALSENRLLRGIPEAYQWARLGSELLTVRVKGDCAPNLKIAGNAVFTGPAGAGKTSLAVAYLLRERVCGVRATFVHAYQLANARAQSGWGREADIVERAMRAQLVLIDDVGNERKTEMSAVSDVIFERHANATPTWVTTAFSPQQIAERYGDGVARRIFERATIIKLGRTK